MNKIITLIICVTLNLSLIAQDNWGLIGIIDGPFPIHGMSAAESIRPSTLEKTPSGGKLELVINNKINLSQFCKSKYLFTWNFSRPLSELRTGDTFNISFAVQLMQGTCKDADAKMTIAASAGYSPQYKAAGVNSGTGGVSFTNYKFHNWVFANGWRNMQNTYSANNALGTIVPWGGQYLTIRVVFHSINLTGSENFNYEVVYLYKKNASPEVVTETPTMDCPNYNSWYWLADNHPWQGLGITKLRQSGYRELYYYHISGSGGSYFLKDTNNNIVRVHGTRVFYVNWDCFGKHWVLDRTEQVNSQNISYKEIYKNKKTGTELVFNFIK